MWHRKNDRVKVARLSGIRFLLLREGSTLCHGRPRRCRERPGLSFNDVVVDISAIDATESTNKVSFSQCSNSEGALSRTIMSFLAVLARLMLLLLMCPILAVFRTRSRTREGRTVLHSIYIYTVGELDVEPEVQ